MNMQTVEGYPVEKLKVRSADIVVHGTVGKPYYEIKYQTADGEWHIGYSSRKLEMVFGWFNECFEIVSYEQEIRDKAIDTFLIAIETLAKLHGAVALSEIQGIAEKLKEVGNEEKCNIQTF